MTATLTRHRYRPHDPDGWYACEEPERPADKHTRYVLACLFCAHKWKIEHPDLPWLGTEA